LYPLEFASIESSNTSDGQATTHKLQPLQRSIFTTTAPFIFAIFIMIYNCHTKVTKNYLMTDFENRFFSFLYIKKLKKPHFIPVC
jgi:hypothetical protein